MNIEVVTWCEYAQTVGNNLNIISALNNFKTEKIPLIPTSLYFAVRFRYDELDTSAKDIHFNFTDPEGKNVIDELMARVEMQNNVIIPEIRSFNLILNLSRVSFPKVGIYKMVIKCDDKEYESLLSVSLKK